MLGEGAHGLHLAADVSPLQAEAGVSHGVGDLFETCSQVQWGEHVIAVFCFNDGKCICDPWPVSDGWLFMPFFVFFFLDHSLFGNAEYIGTRGTGEVAISKIFQEGYSQLFPSSCEIRDSFLSLDDDCGAVDIIENFCKHFSFEIIQLQDVAGNTDGMAPKDVFEVKA